MTKLLEQLNKNTQQTTKVGDLFDVKTGGTPSRAKPKFYLNGNIPWVKTQELVDSVIYDTDEKITQDAINNSNAKVFPKNSVILAMYGATVGKLGILGVDASTNQACATFIPSKNSDIKFLYYLLLRNRQRIISEATGSAQQNLSVDKIRNFEFGFPNFQTQKKIASILSAYDAKIENNNKIIKNLEATAQTIFNEWFVKFHFPGYEKVKMVESEMEGIPEGWGIKNIKDVFTVVLGGTPSREKSQYWNGNIPWINSGEVNKLRILEATEHITELGLNKSNARLVKSGATVIAITGATLGQVSRLEIDSTANQSVIGIFDKDNILNEYLYLFISNNILDLISGASGGAQQHINKQMVENYKILIPSESVVQQFNKKVFSIFRLIKELLKENISLKSQRDQLLVKLI